MVWKWLFDVLTAPLHLLVSLLPEISIPDVSDQVSGLWGLWQWFAWANEYMPLDHAVTMAGLLLTGWAALQVVHVTVWLLTKAHILGGSS